MKYIVQQVANGWIVETRDEDQVDQTYVFDSIREMADWLSLRHGESRPRKLIEDWH